jgi:hypothetical protein
VSEERVDQLRELQRGSDQLVLLETIRRCQGRLAVLASGEQGTGLGPGAAVGDRTQESRSLEVFMGDLQTLWPSSQPRRRKPRTRTGKRTRPDPFEADVALIEGWLQAEPGCVPFRGVKAEARMPWSEGEQGGMTGCHSGGADAPH